jgi:hypothetical protein
VRRKWLFLLTLQSTHCVILRTIFVSKGFFNTLLEESDATFGPGGGSQSAPTYLAPARQIALRTPSGVPAPTPFCTPLKTSSTRVLTNQESDVLFAPLR